jgi:hypothetical protein
MPRGFYAKLASAGEMGALVPMIDAPRKTQATVESARTRIMVEIA